MLAAFVKLLTFLKQTINVFENNYNINQFVIIELVKLTMLCTTWPCLHAFMHVQRSHPIQM